MLVGSDSEDDSGDSGVDYRGIGLVIKFKL
jgi:hypothetical protein